jgi:hypothetical protein
MAYPITWRTASSSSNRRSATLSIRTLRTTSRTGIGSGPWVFMQGSQALLVKEQHALVPQCSVMYLDGCGCTSLRGGRPPVDEPRP